MSELCLRIVHKAESSGDGSEGAHLGSCSLCASGSREICLSSRECLAVSDCRKLGANFKKVKETDDLMLAVRVMLKNELGDFLQNATIVNVLGCMVMCICSMVLGLKDEKQYGTMQAVAHDFCIVAQEVVGKPLPRKWASRSG